jgi:hypothetical protein
MYLYYNYRSCHSCHLLICDFNHRRNTVNDRNFLCLFFFQILLNAALLKASTFILFYCTVLRQLDALNKFCTDFPFRSMQSYRGINCGRLVSLLQCKIYRLCRWDIKFCHSRRCKFSCYFFVVTEKHWFRPCFPSILKYM